MGLALALATGLMLHFAILNSFLDLVNLVLGLRIDWGKLLLIGPHPDGGGGRHARHRLVAGLDVFEEYRGGRLSRGRIAILLFQFFGVASRTDD
jgi:hypothetical protein